MVPGLGARIEDLYPEAVSDPATSALADAWPDGIHQLMRSAGVRQVNYVPDAGLSRLIANVEADDSITATVCTTEEEGIAISCGAWIGGQRSVVLMQSSGVGNCINMLSLPVLTRSPLVMVVTMRGEWAEFNPWQVPMSRATEPSLQAIGVQTLRVDRAEEVVPTVRQAMTMAYEADQQVAVLLSQRLLGEKVW